MDSASARDVLLKLSHLEHLTWGELMTGATPRLKQIPVDHCDSKAAKRLKQLQLDDIEDLVEYRLAGERRVWGIRVGGVCQLLWWDPKHAVCPSKKKHT